MRNSSKTNEQRLREFREGESCLTCDCFLKQFAFCRWWKAQPPIETIVMGCEQWGEKIPF